MITADLREVENDQQWPVSLAALEPEIYCSTDDNQAASIRAVEHHLIIIILSFLRTSVVARAAVAALARKSRDEVSHQMETLRDV